VKARAGVTKVRVFPLLFTRDGASQLPDPSILRRFDAPWTNILFVGRMAPNKCVEDLIQAFAWYQRIPEAMDGAGVLYEDLNPCEMAQLICLVVSNAALRETILVSQLRRMVTISHRDTEHELRALLMELPGVSW
jgi:hypothetical protein